VLVCPSARDAIAPAVGQAAREGRCVLWLDDLERYLGDGGLTAYQVGRLLAGQGARRIIVATIRTAERARISAVASGDDVGRPASREIRHVLDLAHPIRVDRIFSREELKRAEDRTRDPRIAEAIDHADSYGIAEYLAAGPMKLHEWQDARDSSEGPHARGAALVAAAIDIRRAGYIAPLPRTLLSQVHELYLSDPTRAYALREPADEAWAWATRLRPATVALLRPVDPDLVEVFDYLVDVVQRRDGPLARAPGEVVWMAIDHAGPADAAWLAFTAHAQARYALAEHGYRKALEAMANDSGLGPNNLDELRIRNNLALVLHERGISK
jgi:hypothetical protein